MSGLRAALGVERGIVAAVGAGGKKSLLWALAGDHTGRLAWTTSVHSTRPPRPTGLQMHYGRETELIEQARSLRGPGSARHGFMTGEVKSGRRSGLSPGAIERVYEEGRFDLMLVKADGARMRGIKAPKPGEPVLPRSTGLVLYVVSAAVIGQPLDEATAHRPERLAAITGIDQGDLLTPECLARLLSSGDGALQGIGEAGLVPVINQVDDPDRLQSATLAARAALARCDRFDRVVLTCLKRRYAAGDAVVAVIRR